MNFAIGLVIATGCIFGGYAALGGNLEALAQPDELIIIIGGASLGIFIVANTTSTIKDRGKAFLEAILDRAPQPRDDLDALAALHALDPRRRRRPKLRTPDRDAAPPRSSGAASPAQAARPTVAPIPRPR